MRNYSRACSKCVTSDGKRVQEVLGLHGLPKEVQPEMLESETFLKALHHVLLEVHVEEGALICPESGE